MTGGTEEQLTWLMETWGIDDPEAAAIFGVDVEALADWRETGVPAPHRAPLADLVAATRELERRLRPGRISSVVRRPTESGPQRSLLAIAQTGDCATVRSLVSNMFDLRVVQP